MTKKNNNDKVDGGVIETLSILLLRFLIDENTMLKTQATIAMTILNEIAGNYPYIVKEFASEEQLNMLSDYRTSRKDFDKK